MKKSKKEKLDKIINPHIGKTVILPMDHCINDGPIPGLVNMKETIQKVKKGGVDAIVLHKGIYKNNREIIGDLPTFIHLSASTCMGVELKKVLVTTPKEVLDLGADAVSIHLNIGNKYEPEMLKDLGKVSGECEKLGLPLLAMIYPRNIEEGKIITYNTPEKVKHAARLAEELGVDIVKVPYTGSAETFREVVKSVSIPVVIAGGAKGSEEEIITAIKDCMSSGAAGISVGRNAFQAENVPIMIQKMREAVYGY